MLTQRPTPACRAPRRYPAARAVQRGTSLLEVLVAILIISFGMLGAAGLTAASMQYAKMTQFQAISTQLAAEFGDRMRGNRTGFTAGSYDRTAGFSGATAAVSVPTCAVADNCTSAELAAIDNAQWTNSLRRQLPSGHAYVVRDALNVWAADLWVMWIDPNLAAADGTTLGVTGGTACPAAAVATSYTGPAPRCAYFRITQ